MTAHEAPCIAGDHWPNGAGTACAYCGLPAIASVGPDPVALYAFTYYSDDADAERDAAQLARIGGRAILRYYADTRPRGMHWTIALRPGHGNALDASDAAYQRRARAARDTTWTGFARSPWPIMRAADELRRDDRTEADRTRTRLDHWNNDGCARPTYARPARTEAGR